MKILHTLSQKPEATGSGITIRAVIEESNKRGHENFLLAGITRGEIYDLPFFLQKAFVEFKTEALPFEVAGMSDVMPYRSTRFSELSEDNLIKYERAFKEKLIEVVKSFKPDIIHAHHLWIFTSLIKRTFPDIPLIAHCHGTDLRQFQLCPFHRERVLSGCSQVDGVFVLSKSQKEQVIKTYRLSPDIVFLTGTGYNEKLFYNGIRTETSEIDVVYGGKLSRAKGVYWLLEALKEIKDFTWRLHLAGSGSGPEKDEILKKAEEMKDRVICYGHISQREMAELMRKSHIFVLPSFYEGFPLVLIEALASGCRIIVTELPPVMEMKEGINFGKFLITVPLPGLDGPDRPVEKDLPLFVKHLKNALEEQFKICLSGIKGSQEDISSVLKYYTWSEVFKRIEKGYNTVLNHLILSKNKYSFPPSEEE